MFTDTLTRQLVKSYLYIKHRQIIIIKNPVWYEHLANSAGTTVRDPTFNPILKSRK